VEVLVDSITLTLVKLEALAVVVEENKARLALELRAVLELADRVSPEARDAMLPMALFQ
jgi:hypothetical protein